MQTETQITVDSEGYLTNPEDWNEAVAQELAREEGIDVDNNYWPVLKFIRHYWAEHGVTPDVRHVIKFLVDEQGLDKKDAKQHLFKLFPYGYVQQACKIAGMLKPRAWSTG